MKKRSILIISIAVFMGLAVFGVVSWRSSRRPDVSKLRGGRDYNVILITLDTTRADRLGCYGFRNIETPTIDLLASRGIRFDKCYAQTPLTLPSHTSIMTGTLPLFHGVRDNGGFIVPPGLKTMAELFKEKGYDTAAFIAAYVLDSKWGLDQGFDTYFDQFDLSKFKKISLGTVQRPANEVMDEALPWLEKKKNGKFFIWIHLYDPHSPYEPPPPYDRQYPNHPYLGEIAFADSQLGRLWQFLEGADLVENSFLILAGDHGESLGEHEEGSHGFFVYQAAIHVPLIFSVPFSRFQGLSSAKVASLSDVLPTVCELSGIPIPTEVQGRSLLPSFFRPGKEDGSLAYSETFYPRFHYGWSDLKSIQNRTHKLILAPVPELYDIVQDPREQKNLVYLQKDVFEEMSSQADSFIQKNSQNAYETDTSKIDEETREKLAALGYVGSFTDPSKLKGKTLANPKDKIGIFNELSRAREIGMGGRPDEAIEIIQSIIASDPEITNAYFTMGNIYFQQKKFSEAIEYFQQVLGRKPDDTFAAINVALSYEGMGKFDDAEDFLLDYLSKGFKDSQFYFMLGNMNFLQKKYDRAIPYFEECISLNADSAGSHNMLAAIYIIENDLPRATEHIQQAIQLNPRLSTVHYNQAQIYEKEGKIQEAEAAYLRELESSPKHFKSMYNLSRLYRMMGDTDREYEYLQKCIETEPNFPLSYFYLARIYLNRGERYQEAIDLVEKGIELKPEKAELPLGYFLLADLYDRLGDNARSQEYAQKGQSLARSNAR